LESIRNDGKRNWAWMMMMMIVNTCNSDCKGGDEVEAM
jgi:hypothetical protein